MLRQGLELQVLVKIDLEGLQALERLKMLPIRLDLSVAVDGSEVKALLVVAFGVRSVRRQSKAIAEASTVFAVEVPSRRRRLAWSCASFSSLAEELPSRQCTELSMARTDCAGSLRLVDD